MNWKHAVRIVSVASGVLAVAWFPGSPAFAQSQPDRVSELEKKLERSLRLIDELASKITQLEANAPRKEDMARQEVRIESVAQQVSAVAAAGSRRGSDDGIALHGFADVGAAATNGGPNKKGFGVGSMSFYLTPQFGDNVKTLLELIFEYDTEGGLATDLERVQLGYTFSDALTLWAGRFHTPYGYWNTAFHHGLQIQTSLRRPKFVDFEDKGGILPSHSVGLWATGGMRAGEGKWSWDLYAGNSPSISENVINMNNSGSRNHNLGSGANLGYSFGGALEGLKLGAHLLTARVVDDADPVNTTKLGMTGAYAVYDTDKWEHIAEVYRFNNRDAAGGGARKSTAGFAQFGYRTPPWTSYVRFEKTSLDQGDGYFARQESGQSYNRQALGLRLDLNLKSAVKFEIARTKNTDRDLGQYSEFLAQYAIRF